MSNQEPLFDENKKQKNAIVFRKEGSGITPTDFASLGWVLRARSEDPMRPHICGLYSEGNGKFIATDGHRMHIAEIPGMEEKIPEGIWLYVSSTAKQISILEAPEGIGKYPDYERISSMTEAHESKGMIAYAGNDTDTLWQFWDLVGVKCNIEYLMDVLKCNEAMTVHAAPDPLAGIFFTREDNDGNTKKAILMSLKA